MGVVGGIGYFGVLPAWSVSNRADRPLMSVAKRATLTITVSERGNLESCVTVDGICELNGAQNKIIYLVPEGTKVKKGDVVCKFDGSEIEKNIAQQEIKYKQATAKIETTQQEMEIQRNKGESDIIAAKVELTLAKLDLEKYEKGDYPAETTKQQGEMGSRGRTSEAENAKLEQFKALMKKGFKTSEDVRIQNSTVEAKKLDYSSAKQFLEVKEKYEYKRKTTEFSSKAEQAQKKVEQAVATAKAQMSKAASEYESAKATADIEQQQLKEFLKQKDKTVIRAEQDGIVAYSNDRYWDASSQIREGATVYSRQKIFSLPDMTQMQVKVNIHESLIKKIKAGQKAEIRIDAFPNIVFVGTVKSVSQLADSTRPWMTGGVKEYPTIVTIDDLMGNEVKPSMTAEAEILVGELKNVLVVPVQAVAEHKGEFFAFVEEPGGLLRRKVKIGENNETQVQVLEGLKEGDSVALDARLRLAAEFKTEDAKDSKGADGSKAERRAGQGQVTGSGRHHAQLYIAIALAIRNLTLHKLRVFLTILGLIFGVSSVIAMLAIAEGASLEAQRQIAELGATNVIVRSTKPIDEVNPSKQQNNDSFIFKYGLTYKDFERIVETMPTVTGATPLREFRQSLRHLDQEIEGRVVGVNPDFLSLTNQKMDEGRFLTDADLFYCANVVVIGAEVAEKLFPYGDPAGQDDPDRREPLLPDHRRDRAQGLVGRHRVEPRGPGFQQGRLHPPDDRPRPLRRGPDEREAGELHRREDRALPDHRGRRLDGERQAHRRRRSTACSASSTPRRTTRSPSRSSCSRRPRRPSGSSTWSWARSPASRCWSAASGS